MDRVLFVPCYPGELGWELINYIPYVNHIVCNEDYKEVHVVTRIGRESLYPMATSTYPIFLSNKDSMGNTGSAPPKNPLSKTLKERFETVDIVSPLPRGMRYAKHRTFIKYRADSDSLARWNIPSKSVVCVVRGRNFGTHKNWKGNRWRKLCVHLIEKNITPVISGLKELVDFELPDGCIDTRDQTTMADLVAIMQKSIFVIGQSSGPMHLASLAGVPHAVWGHPRLHERYTKS